MPSSNRLQNIDDSAIEIGIRQEGYTGPIPHSACWCCPNQSDAEWLDMKLNYPADFAAACALEIEIQQEDPHFWMHPSCLPLSEVNFTAQFTMFSDRGCTTGCFT